MGEKECRIPTSSPPQSYTPDQSCPYADDTQLSSQTHDVIPAERRKYQVLSRHLLNEETKRDFLPPNSVFFTDCHITFTWNSSI